MMRGFFARLIGGRRGAQREADDLRKDDERRQQMQEVRVRLQVVREQLEAIKARKADGSL